MFTNTDRKLLIAIYKDQRIIMSALDDLNTEITTLTASIDAEITALQTAQATNNDAGIAQATANLKSLNDKLQASMTPAQPTPVATPAQ